MSIFIIFIIPIVINAIIAAMIIYAVIFNFIVTFIGHLISLDWFIYDRDLRHERVK